MALLLHVINVVVGVPLCDQSAHLDLDSSPPGNGGF